MNYDQFVLKSKENFILECLSSNKKYYIKNKEKIKERVRLYEKTHPEYKKQNAKKYRDKHKIHRRYLYRKFGISEDEYLKMLEEQNYCCALCGSPQTNFKYMLAIDHNHKTGKVRALLCPNCNQGLGNFKDNINLLTKAIEYLKNHNT
jgi:hypothetical protein